MTRHIFVTRADGRPAYEHFKGRLRQSEINRKRGFSQRYAELIAEAREPVELTDDPTGAVSFLADRQTGGRLSVAAIGASLVLFAAVYAILP